MRQSTDPVGVHQVNSPRNDNSKAIRLAAIALRAKGFWPVAIYPPGYVDGKGRTRIGKEPIGPGWGLERKTVDEIDRMLRDFPGASLGICVGPGRGPGGKWLVDIEGDGPRAEESRLKLFGGEIPETLGWLAARGDHGAFTAEGERLLALLKRCGATEGTGHSAGVHTLPDDLPDLEFRIGGRKADGTVKQLQSVVPPSSTTEGKPREWSTPLGNDQPVADLPEAAYQFLERLAAEKEAARVESEPAGPKASSNGRAKKASSRAEPRKRAYVENALRDEITAIAGLTPGTRHTEALPITMRLASLVKSGLLDVGEYRSSVGGKLIAIGLPRDEVDGLINSALEKAGPRENLPDFDADGGGPNATFGIPSPGDPDGDETPTFENFSEILIEKKGAVDGEPEMKAIRVPMMSHAIKADLSCMVGSWPKRVDETLFVEGSDHTPIYLNSATRLFAWVDSKAMVTWAKGEKFVSQERFFEHLRMSTFRYDAIETLPHFPELPNIYYMHKPVPDPPGLLEQLLDRFNPASDVDRELIKAMILTFFWGGEPGNRPAFLVTGPDGDDAMGRGIGKSTMAMVLAMELVGGYIDVTAKDEIADLKTRMLSTEEGRKRVVLLDNVKTLRFSWAELEGLITNRLISGRALYKGEGQRPNTLCWIVTLNGANLSKDMAQRVIPIKLNRPTYSGDWEKDLREFIRENRWGLIADIKQNLEDEEGLCVAKTRWAAWEKEVLSKTDMGPQCQAVILDRQHGIDDDEDQAFEIERFIATKIEERRHNTEAEKVKIATELMAEWMTTYERKTFSAAASTSFLKNKPLHRLVYKRSSSERCWVWVGEKSGKSDVVDLKDLPDTEQPRYQRSWAR